MQTYRHDLRFPRERAKNVKKQLNIFFHEQRNISVHPYIKTHDNKNKEKLIYE